MDATQLRNLVKEVSGKQISSEDAQVILVVFKDDLQATITGAYRQFVTKHFGTKNILNEAA
jgi:hypothetical protein